MDSVAIEYIQGTLAGAFSVGIRYGAKAVRDSINIDKPLIITYNDTVVMTGFIDTVNHTVQTSTKPMLEIAGRSTGADMLDSSVSYNYKDTLSNIVGYVCAKHNVNVQCDFADDTECHIICDNDNGFYTLKPYLQNSSIYVYTQYDGSVLFSDKKDTGTARQIVDTDIISIRTSQDRRHSFHTYTTYNADGSKAVATDESVRASRVCNHKAVSGLDTYSAFSKREARKKHHALYIELNAFTTEYTIGNRVSVASEQMDIQGEYTIEGVVLYSEKNTAGCRLSLYESD